MSHILLSTDGSRSSLVAAEYTAALVKLVPSLKVTILAVEDDEVRGEEVIARTKEIFDQAGIEVKTVINKGKEEVGDIIAYYANHGPYTQVIMGRRGLNRIQGLLLGSVSKKVIKKAKCPVTVIPIDTKVISPGK